MEIKRKGPSTILTKDEEEGLVLWLEDQRKKEREAKTMEDEKRRAENRNKRKEVRKNRNSLKEKKKLESLQKKEKLRKKLPPR